MSLTFSTVRRVLGAGLLYFCLTASASAQFKPAYSMQLDKKEVLGSSLQLANGQLVLFFSQPKVSDVRVVLLRPDGKMQWEKKLTKMQSMSVKIDPNSGTFLNTTPVETVHPTLEPLEVFASGNTIYAVETIGQDMGSDDKKDQFKEHDILLQRLDSTGEVSRMLLPYKDMAKQARLIILLSYVDQDVFYQYTREWNARKETDEYFLNAYDLKNKRREHLPLLLPPGRVDENQPQYNENWRVLAHHNGVTYLFRRRLTDAAYNPEHFVPQQYEVLLYNNQGQKIGGFAPELNLGPYRAMRKTLDEGVFAFDPETETIFFSGEYEALNKSKLVAGGSTEGFFAQQYDKTGKLLFSKQVVYTEHLPTKDKSLAKQMAATRDLSVYVDPLTQRVAADVRLEDDHVVMYFDEQMTFEKSVLQTKKELRDLHSAADKVFVVGPYNPHIRLHTRMKFKEVYNAKANVYLFRQQVPAYAGIMNLLTPKSRHVLLYLTRSNRSPRLLVDYSGGIQGGKVSVFQVPAGK